MCDPVTLGAIAVNAIQGNVNRDAVSRQAGEANTALGQARSALETGQETARTAIEQGTSQAVGTLDPFAQMGLQAGRDLYGMTTGQNPLTSDAMFQRELQLASQAGAARGQSTSPSFLAETSAALVPGLEQRKAALLSPIFTAGLNSATNIANLQSGQGTALADLANAYSPIFANLAVQKGNVAIENIKQQTPNYLQMWGNAMTNFNPNPTPIAAFSGLGNEGRGSVA